MFGMSRRTHHGPSSSSSPSYYGNRVGNIPQGIRDEFPRLDYLVFSNSFLLPKLQWLWQHNNLTGSKAQWLMDASNFLARGMQFGFSGIIVLLVALELCVSAWPRYRRTVVSIVTILFHTIVLLGLTAIATSVLLAAPLLTRTK